MRGGAVGRWGVVLGVVVLLGACEGDPAQVVTPEPSPAVSPTPVGVAEVDMEPTATPAPEPTVDAEAQREARLEELRETAAFVEFAEHDRAPGGRWGVFTYTQFGIAGDGEIVGEWTNKKELWDEVAPPFRDECLLAGPPATEPLWDNEIVIPAGVGSRWNNEATEGRGQFVEFVCVYEDPHTGEEVERYGAALVTTDEQGRGTMDRSMPPFEVRESDVDSSEERTAHIRQVFWEWIVEHPGATS